MPVHQVAQGDTLVTIAHTYGFVSWQKIWDHADNADLRATRSDPMVLSPGDQVVIPAREPKFVDCKTTATHTFKIRKLTSTFSMRMVDECDEPYAGCRYELKAGDKTYEGQVPWDGTIEHEVDPTAKTGLLKLWPNKEDADEVLSWELDIGHLDPVDSISGVQARLNHLGYKAGPVDGVMNDQTKAAISAFQIRIGYEAPNGELDDRTREALVEAQGGF